MSFLKKLFGKAPDDPPRKGTPDGGPLVDVPDYDDVSDFLIPAHARDLGTGLRLDPDALRLLVKVMNHTYGKPRSTYAPRGESPQVDRLLGCGFIEPDFQNQPHWAWQGTPKEFRITEKGALRLLDPEALVVHEIMER